MVIKKDNTREYFDGDKIKYGILKSCEKRPVSVEQIEEIVAFIENEINKHYISEIETEKIRLERPVLGQDTTDVLALACVDVEVHAATCLAERDADQSFGVGYRFHRSCSLLSANIHHSFIKMAYISLFKA